MAPKPKEYDDPSDIPTGFLEEGDEILSDKIPQELYSPGERKLELLWHNIILIAIIQVIAVYGLYATVATAQWATCLWAFIVYEIGVIGIIAGNHRLWAHKAYKAKWPLVLILTLFAWTAHQKSTLVWARDHRMHHKYQDTDADPHNPRRGLFFAHWGWLMVKKHPEVLRKGARLDVSDLYANPIINFQHKYYYYFMPFFTLILPTVVPMYFWNETFLNAYSLNILRFNVTLHATWLINSIAHKWGMRPYDRHIGSAESRFVSFWTGGEGWHNYHHTFPWDYKTSELGKVNISKNFIDLFAKIGWAYDLKEASEEMLKKRVQRTGDGSHHLYALHETKNS